MQKACKISIPEVFSHKVKTCAEPLQGWIKGVNSNILNPNNDIGRDGEATSINKNIARDAFGYSLNYFGDDPNTTGVTESDYKSIGTQTNDFIASVTAAAYLQTDAPNLYNGNISSMITTITDPTTSTVQPQLTAYKYDQLNRIKQMKAYRDITGNAWGDGTGYNGDYQTNVSYDANGNILAMERKGSGGSSTNPMDNLTYKYETVANGYTKNTNKLRYVLDAENSTYSTDIDNQGVDNYTYDEIGNLKGDVQEGIENIEWTVYGKVKTVLRKADYYKTVNGNVTFPADLEFKYDASGNRIAKIVKPRVATAGNAYVSELTTSDKWTTTYYVRDASGNVMATYKDKEDNNGFYLEDQYLYGSSRIGLQKRELDLTASISNDITSRVLGQKSFELSNHLGNVLTTVSDRKIPVDNLGNGTGTTIAYYKANITNASDFGLWGDILPNRGNGYANNYKYGFNGKEKDDEIQGNGNSYDYGFRIYNPRLGKFLSVDPLTRSYPWYTPYQFAGNMPISAIDLDGEEIKTMTGNGNTQVQAIYGVITSGPGAIPLTSADIKKMSIELSLILNNNPGTTVKIKDIPDPIEREKAVREAKKTCPECTYADILEKDNCAQLQFNLILFDAGESRIDKYGLLLSHEANMNLYLKDKDGETFTDDNGKSYGMGGIIIMGTDEILASKKIDPTKAWDNVDEKGNIIPNSTPAFWSGDVIYLNPTYYDKKDPNYKGFKGTINTEVGEIAHEIGHDLSLNHPKGIYPKEGLMSTTPEKSGATRPETEKVIENTPTDPR